MTEVSSPFPVEPSDVLEKFKESEINNIKVQSVNLQDYLSEEPLGEEQLSRLVFANNKNWTAEFAKKCAEGKRMVYQDKNDPNFFYLATSRENELVTVVKANARSLRSQLDIQAESVYITNHNMGNAVDLKSLLPPGDKQPTLRMESDPKNSKKIGKNKFNYSQSTNTLLFNEVQNQDDLASLVHESGHAWTTYLGIDKPWKQGGARNEAYNVVRASEEKGLEVVSAEVAEVLFSERVANIAGSILAKKLTSDDTLQGKLTDFYSRTWRDEHEAWYDASLVQPLIDKYPEKAIEIKTLLASRTNCISNL